MNRVRHTLPSFVLLLAFGGPQLYGHVHRAQLARVHTCEHAPGEPCPHAIHGPVGEECDHPEMDAPREGFDLGNDCFCNVLKKKSGILPPRQVLWQELPRSFDPSPPDDPVRSQHLPRSLHSRAPPLA